jgi:hypothetical protein
VVDRRTDVGIHILGVVTSKNGMRRSRVNADRAAISGFGGIVDVSFINSCQMNAQFRDKNRLTGRFGEAENITRGRIRSVADAADKRDNILNERDLPVFVLIGWGDPLRAAYNERVEDDVNAKAIAADR